MHALCLDGFFKIKNWQLKPISLTKKKYVTLPAKFEVNRDAANKAVYYEIRFIDSFQFLASSLDKLSSNLDTAQKVHTDRLRTIYPVDDDILFRKGIFPYSYLDDDDKLDDGELLPIAAFFDTLSNSLRTSDAEYQHAQKAWRQFQYFSLNDYLKRYLELDCLLLADVFENFRAAMIHNTELDPANFITLPQFTFAAAFRKTNCDLLMEENMYEFFEDGIRGGMTFVNQHHIQADNIDTGNPNASNYIAYWDENNLYGNALSQLLPCSHFEWLTLREINALDWSTVDTEGEFGYTLKVNLEYPDDIHDKT